MEQQKSFGEQFLAAIQGLEDMREQLTAAEKRRQKEMEVRLETSSDMVDEVVARAKRWTLGLGLMLILVAAAQVILIPMVMSHRISATAKELARQERELVELPTKIQKERANIEAKIREELVLSAGEQPFMAEPSPGGLRGLTLPKGLKLLNEKGGKVKTSNGEERWFYIATPDKIIEKETPPRP